MKKLLSSAAYCDKTPVHHSEFGDRFRHRDLEYGFAGTTVEGHVFGVAGAVSRELGLSHGHFSDMLNSGGLVLLRDRRS